MTWKRIESVTIIVSAFMQIDRSESHESVLLGVMAVRACSAVAGGGWQLEPDNE